jgi:transcriptional regulator GlxA family with amidase domain
MYQAAAIVYPDALPTSITLPMEILHAASQMARAGGARNAAVNFSLASADGQPLRLSSGLQLTPDMACCELPSLDLLVLPGIWRNPRATIEAAAVWREQLRALALTDTRICSVGTASCLLAEAGLLEGKPATTHWNYFENFARRYPGVNLKTRHLITQADNIYCAGSVNSVADLVVHVVEGWFGHRIARAIEHQFSPEIRRSFSSAAYEDEPGGSHPDETVLEAQQWLQSRLAGPISIAELARHLGLTGRTLNRRFRQATGLTPQAYLQKIRMVTARELLKHSNLPVSDIAWKLGLSDASYFSALFRSHCGMTPLRYREAVRGKLFAPPQLNETPGDKP